MLSGQWVGSDGAAAISANSGAPLIDFGGGIQILAYDVKSGDPNTDADSYGASAVIKNNVVDIFTSPVVYSSDC
jgi:hypothetical protein